MTEKRKIPEVIVVEKAGRYNQSETYYEVDTYETRGSAIVKMTWNELLQELR